MKKLIKYLKARFFDKWYAIYRLRDRQGNWTEWKEYVYLGETKNFIKIRHRLFFTKLLPKKGLGMEIWEVTQ